MTSTQTQSNMSKFSSSENLFDPPIDNSFAMFADLENNQSNDIPVNPNRRKTLIPPSHMPSNIAKLSQKTFDDAKTSNSSTLIIDDSDEFIPESIKPSSMLNENDYFKSTHYSHDDDEETFDRFVLNHFLPFSGAEDVIQWLQETEQKFNKFKLSRKQRFSAIPLLITGSAKIKYIRIRDQIHIFDDFTAYLLTHYEKSVSFSNKSSSGSQTDPSSSEHSLSHGQSKFESELNNHDTLNHSHFSPCPPILRSTALSDVTAKVPVGRSQPSQSETQSSNSIFSLDNTTNDLRKAILESFIKTPKIFKGEKKMSISGSKTSIIYST